MNNENIDPQEIAKFDTIAEDWWNPNGPMKPLHDLNPLRLDYIKQFTTLKNKTVVDVGCGGGILTESLSKEGAHASGIDLSEQVLIAAKAHAQQQNLNIDYQHISVEALTDTNANKFDVVTCMEMLEHVPQPDQIIKACAKLLKPGGRVFFSTIHRNPKAYLFAILGAEYLLNLLPKGTHDYSKFIRPSELNQWAVNAKLSLVDLSGMQYSPFKKTFSLGKDISVNYLTCYQLKES